MQLQTNETLRVGDEIMVIVTDIDDKGRVNLACKDAYENKKEGKSDKKDKKDFHKREKKENK